MTPDKEIQPFLDYGVGTKITYSDGVRTVQCEVVALFYGDFGSVHTQLINTETGKIFQRSGHCLPKEFSLTNPKTK